MKILLVEDDKKVGSFIYKALAEEGYVVDRAHNLSEGEASFRQIAYDAIILDWMLPDGDGVSLCRSIRQSGSTTPIMMLTARSEVGEKVVALDAGADDYLTKPFALEEFLARVRALARRSVGGALNLRVGPLQLDLRTRTVLNDGQRVELTAKEFALLELLVRHAPRILSRSEILTSVWSLNADPGSNLIEVHIRHLRDKLGATAPRIETVRTQGYRFAFQQD